MTGQIKNFNFLKKYKNFVCIVCFNKNKYEKKIQNFFGKLMANS